MKWNSAFFFSFFLFVLLKILNEIQFTYHITHPIKSYNLMAFGVFRELRDYMTTVNFRTFSTSQKRNLAPLSHHLWVPPTPPPIPLQPLIFLFCLCVFKNILWIHILNLHLYVLPGLFSRTHLWYIQQSCMKTAITELFALDPD